MACNKLLVVYHYFAHYRQPIMTLLCRGEKTCLQTTMVSDKTSNRDNLTCIDPSLADLPSEQGGLRWKFVKNHWFKRVFLWQSGLHRILRDEQYDTVIFLGTMYYFSTWVGAILAKRRGKRVLMWGHGFIKPKTDGRIKLWLRKQFYKLAHGHLFYNHHARDNAIRLEFEPETLYVVFNSLDYDKQLELRCAFSTEQRQTIRAELFEKPDLPILLWIGRLTPQKKLWMILDAARTLHDRDQPVNILMIGDGSERQSLQAKVRELRLEAYVHFFGACHDETILAPMISASDLCCAPGEIGLTAIHALAYGTPCITHDNPEAQGPEFEAICPGKTGTLYRYGDADDFAEKISQWLRDAPDRDTVRDSCYRIIDDYYNPHKQAQIIEAAVKGVPASQVDMGIKDFSEAYRQH